MAILDESDLQDLGDLAIELVCKDTCSILRNTRVRTPSGGYTDTWQPPIATGVPCAIVNSGAPLERVIGQQVVGEITQKCLLPKGQDVLGNDRVLVNGLTTYRVIDLLDPTTYEVLRRVLVERLSVL